MNKINIKTKIIWIANDQFLKQFDLSDLLMDSGATPLYLFAIWDDESLYPKIETGYPFTPDMKNDLVDKFIDGIFNQGSAILKVKYYNPPDIIFQHIPVKERVNKIEVMEFAMVVLWTLWRLLILKNLYKLEKK